jgi:GNAT superfamily N-acetyltransferase
MVSIWNTVVEDGSAFPQVAPLEEESAARFFAAQSFTAVAEGEGEILGLYILHPNNIGRCGHLANASYAVRKAERGRHVGELLVSHSLEKGRELGFKILQFNAVVRSNTGAIRLYEKLGFVRLGTVPDGFLMKDNTYEDILLFYHTL